MSAPFDVVVVGGYCLDLIFTGLPAFPQLGVEVVSTGFDLLPGGAFNSAAAMHRLGLKVGWAADFGNDEVSQFVLAQSRAEGLDESLFVLHPRPHRHVTVALSYPQDRAFVAHYDPAPPDPAAERAVAEAATTVLYLAHFHYEGQVFETALARAKAEGLKLLMDGNLPNCTPSLKQPEVKRALAGVNVFLPNAVEACGLTGRSDAREALQVLAQFCPVVVVKDGPSGAYACAGGEVVHQPALAVTPVDTTGAGDCFSAGFVRAWYDGLPLAECLRWGNIVGGLSTLARGGAGRRVTPDDVRQWL